MAAILRSVAFIAEGFCLIEHGAVTPSGRRHPVREGRAPARLISAKSAPAAPHYD